MKITLVSVSGRATVVDTAVHGSLPEISSHLQSVFGLPTSQIRYFLNDKVISADSTLSSLGLRDGSRISFQPLTKDGASVPAMAREIDLKKLAKVVTTAKYVSKTADKARREYVTEKDHRERQSRRDPENFDFLVNQIVELGHPRKVAEEALRMNKYNPNLAVEYIMGGEPFPVHTILVNLFEFITGGQDLPIPFYKDLYSLTDSRRYEMYKDTCDVEMDAGEIVFGLRESIPKHKEELIRSRQRLCERYFSGSIDSHTLRAELERLELLRRKLIENCNLLKKHTGEEYNIGLDRLDLQDNMSVYERLSENDRKRLHRLVERYDNIGGMSTLLQMYIMEGENMTRLEESLRS